MPPSCPFPFPVPIPVPIVCRVSILDARRIQRGKAINREDEEEGDGDKQTRRLWQEGWRRGR